MKHFFILLFIFATLCCATAQEQPERKPIRRLETNQLNDMINYGFESYIQSYNDFNARSTERVVKYIYVFIEMNRLPLGFTFSDKIKQMKNLKFVDYNRRGLWLKERQGIVFSGIYLENNRLEIRFVNLGIKSRMWKQFYGITDSGWHLIYEYSCDKNEWVLIKNNSPRMDN